MSLDSNAEERSANHRQWRHEGIGDDDIARIRQHMAQKRAWGDERFQLMVEKP